MRTQFKGRQAREEGRASSVSVNPLDTSQGEAVLPGVFLLEEVSTWIATLGRMKVEGRLFLTFLSRRE